MEKVEKGGNGEWRTRTLLKYTLVQIPGLALLIVILCLVRDWLDLSARLMGTLIVLWIIKDILLFPVLRRSYEGSSSEHEHPMIGARGTAKDRLDPSGYAWVHGELWRAEVIGTAKPLEKGESLRVQNIRGLTLLVVLDQEDEE